MKAVLGLDDGTILTGNGFGIEGSVTGELVVSLISNGYMGTLSDPNTAGQLVMFGYPLIGNYGVNTDEFQSDKVHAAGTIVHELCLYPKHTPNLYEYFKSHDLIGIEGIDTRMLTVKLRDHGVMNATIITGSDDGQKAVTLSRQSPINELKDHVRDVTCKKPYHISGSGKKVAVLDLGCRSSILTSLHNRGADLYVYPYDTPYDVILSDNPQSVLLTNGPGNPNSISKTVQTIKNLVGNIPSLIGIGMGANIIAVALGCETEKLKFGHRSTNQPVKFQDGSITVTTQSHGYVIDPNSVPTDCNISCTNLNDHTIEGFTNTDLNINCVMFYPEPTAVYDPTEKPIYDTMYRGIPDA